MTIKSITIKSEPLRFLDVGEGPVLLFGHGYLLNMEMWRSQIDCLSQSYRCIVPDLWGHGETKTIPENTRSLADVADDMLALMDSLEIDTFSIVGLAIGAMWGAEVAIKAPSRVTSFVMADSFLGFEPEVLTAKYNKMLANIQQLNLIPAPTLAELVPLYFGHGAEQKTPQLLSDMRSSLSLFDASRIPAIVAVGRMQFNRREILLDFEKLALPVLLLVGQEDKQRPYLESYLMHDSIDGSEFVVIPNAGHVANVEQPEAFNNAVTAFLAKHH